MRPDRDLLLRAASLLLLAALADGSLAACAVTPPAPTVPAASTQDSAAAPPPTQAVSTPTPPAAPTPTVQLKVFGMTARSFSSVSPDGQWRAEAQLASFPGETPYEYERVTVWRTDMAESWTPYEMLLEYGGLGWGYLSAFHWSADGRYLYFEHTAASDGCGYPLTTELHQVNLVERSLRPIPLTGMLFGEVTLSPGAERMAYRVEGGILLHDQASGRTQTVPYAWPEGFGYLVGWHAWSPDGNELAFSVTSPLCDSPEPPSSTTTVIDLRTGDARAPGRGDAWVYLPERIAADPIPSAAIALHDFLASLYWGARGGLGEDTYARAVALYGGSYETLIDLNPDLDPDDHAALLRRACEANGFQCLPLRDVLSSFAGWGQGGARVVYLTVYLEAPDGGIFTRGPCCGEEAGLPETRFTFTVQDSEDGSYKVLELPPYVP